MATIKEMKEKVMACGEISEEMIDNLSAYQFVSAYNLACEAEKCFNQLSELFGVNIFPKEECGCGGCEIALAECLEIDASGMTTEEFIKACFELLEGRFSDEVQ